jgi:hypothetical protein
MIALVPVSRFRIVYEVAAGRPFSEFERLVLAAIEGGATSLAALQSIFFVHRRLLIESLITLTQAGWLAVGAADGGEFVLTAEGRGAAKGEAVPATTVATSRTTFVVMDRISGGLISNDEVRFVTRREVGRLWETSARLVPVVADNRLDESQVQHLLPRRQGEWVRWIGPIDMVSKEAHWLPVNVDLDSEALTGLPEKWAARLKDSVLAASRRLSRSMSEEARSGVFALARRRRSVPSDDPDALKLPPVGSRASITADDFAFTQDQHASIVTAALQQSQKNFIIVSASISVGAVERLLPSVGEALRRGVNIDVLWGAAEPYTNAKQIVDRLKKAAYDSRQPGSGALRFNGAPSGIRANVMLWDSEPNHRAWLGSYEWIARDENSIASLDVSMQVTNVRVLSELARTIAAFWAITESEELTSAADRWRRIAADLDMAASSVGDDVDGNATVRLINGREHRLLAREWFDTAQVRFLMSSHEFPRNVEQVLGGVDPEPTERAIEVLYGEDAPEVEGEEKWESVALRRRPGLRGNVLISDSSSCVTSYRFLSPDLAANSREVGILVDGLEPTEYLWTHVAGPDSKH